MPASLMQTLYYRAPDGTEPVNDFVESSSIRYQVILDNQIAQLNLLAVTDPPLAFSAQLAGPWRPARVALPLRQGSVSGALSAIATALRFAARLPKNTRAIPSEEIRIADVRWDNFRARMD